MGVTVEETVEVAVPETSVTEEERREILLRAAELIEERGYTYGTAGMAVDGPFCLVGAVGHAMGSELDPNGVLKHEDRVPGYLYEPIEQFLGSPTFREGLSAWAWSDRQARRRDAAQRVARVLRKMAHGASWEDATKEGETT